MSTVFSASIRLLRLVNREPVEYSRNTFVHLVQDDRYESWFELTGDPNDKVLIRASVAAALNMQFRTKDLVVFFDINYERMLLNFSMIFRDRGQMRAFVQEFTRSVFENANRRRITAKDKPDLDDFVESASLDRVSANARGGRTGATFAAVEHTQESRRRNDGGCNRILRLGEHVDNAIVVRRYDDHCDLGLFTLDRECRFRMAINGLSAGGQPVMIDDMITLNKDHDLALLDRSKVQLMDMTRGMIKDTLRPRFSGVEHRLDHLLESPDDSVVLGFNQKNTMRFDPRASNDIVDMSDYKGSQGFTCGATTRGGRLAMGADNGVVRLYSGPCKSRATVNFSVSAGSEAILGIDVSPDEQWVLATCPYFLAVFNVRASGTGKLAFDAPMGKDKSPVTRLMIKGEHQQTVAQHFDGHLPPFALGRFEIKRGRPVAIVAAIGTGLVSWDFSEIERGGMPSYCITLVGGEIVVDDRVFSSTSDVMFISDNRVSVVGRS